MQINEEIKQELRDYGAAMGCIMLVISDIDRALEAFKGVTDVEAIEDALKKDRELYATIFENSFDFFQDKCKKRGVSSKEAIATLMVEMFMRNME